MLLLSFFLFYFFFKTYLSFYPFSFYLTSFAWFLLSLFFYYFTTPTLPSIYGSHRSFLKLSLSSLSLTSSLIFFYSTSPTFFPQTVASMGAPLSSLSPLFSHHGGHGSHDHGAIMELSLSPLFSHLSFFPLFYLYLSLTSLSFPTSTGRAMWQRVYPSFALPSKQVIIPACSPDRKSWLSILWWIIKFE